VAFWRGCKWPEVGMVPTPGHVVEGGDFTPSPPPSDKGRLPLSSSMGVAGAAGNESEEAKKLN